MEQQLVQVLEKTISSNQSELTAARDFLKEAIATQYASVVLALSRIMADERLGAAVRTQAGLQLKNVLYSLETEQKAINESRWLQLPADIRAQIKAHCCQALATQDQGWHSAAQCVARVACVELPGGHWSGVMALLVDNITGGVSSEALKQASLEAIGYICNDINPNILASQSDQILTGIVFGMKKEEPSNRVRLAATQALLNSLEFTRHNFDNENERNYIMQVVCEATESADENIAVVALQCLVKIMSLYYMYMELYMQQSLLPITSNALRRTDAMVLQGIEFWSTVCEEEIKIERDAAESAERGLPVAANHCKFYARGAIRFLVPRLLEILERHEDGEEWKPYKAAGVCLGLLSQATGNAMVQLVWPYVQQSIKHEDWHKRNAAVLAFGSILKGPSPGSLEPLFPKYIQVIKKLMSDPSPVLVVRASVAWSVGRMSEVLPEVLLNDDKSFPLLMHYMMAALFSEPRVASNACWAFSSLAKGASALSSKHSAAAASKCSADAASKRPRTVAYKRLASFALQYSAAAAHHSDHAKSSAGHISAAIHPNLWRSFATESKLDYHFTIIVDQLLETMERTDGGQWNLRQAAYSALIDMIRSTSFLDYILRKREFVFQKLEGILGMDQTALSAQERSQLAEYQSLLCGVVHVMLRRTNVTEVQKEASKKIIPVLTEFIQRAQSRTNDSYNQYSAIQQNALLAIKVLIEDIGPAFRVYMTDFMGVLLPCLQNSAEPQICSVAVGILGDLARQVEPELVPYIEDVCNILFKIYGNKDTDRSILAPIILTLGELTMQLGESFAQYRSRVIEILNQAEANISDEKIKFLKEECMKKYGNQL